jgi:hypothetical protein
VDTESAAIDSGGERDRGEGVQEGVEDGTVAVEGIELGFEAEFGGNRFEFVIAADHEKIRRIQHFEDENEQDALKRKLAPIDKVAKEKITDRWRQAARLEDPDEIEDLTVDVANNDDRGRKFQESLFGCKDLGDITADPADDLGCESGQWKGATSVADLDNID